MSVNRGMIMWKSVEAVNQSKFRVMKRFILLLCAAAGLTLPAVATPVLINVNCGAHLNAGNLSSNKVGIAATGLTAGDFWNFYSRSGPNDTVWLANNALPNLKLADGTVTAAGLTVSNAAGCWSDGSTDPMYNCYVYPLYGGNATVLFTNLPAGQFDVYIYGPDGNYRLDVDGAVQGTKTCGESAVSNPPVWQEGKQYARFSAVNVGAGQALTITVLPGIHGAAVISGMQLAQTDTNPPPPIAPFITTQPADKTVPVGGNATFSVGAGGSPPLTYQWTFTRTNLNG